MSHIHVRANSIRLLAVTVSVTALLTAAAPLARASPASTCSFSGAHMASGVASDFNLNTGSAHSVRSGAALNGSDVYTATSAVLVSWDRDAARLTAGTRFLLSCWGPSRAFGAVLPLLQVHNGTIRVTDSGKQPMALVTNAALVGPTPGDIGKALSFVVTEHSSPTMWPTTTAGVTGVTRRINITPYVGPRPGTCRVVTSARLVYNPNTNGSATYNLAH